MAGNEKRNRVDVFRHTHRHDGTGMGNVFGNLLIRTETVIRDLGESLPDLALEVGASGARGTVKTLR